MVLGMATRKVTITLHEAQHDRIKDLVHDGGASSVSGFVQHAVALALDDVAAWEAALAAALDQTGGPLTEEERAWADDMLAAPPRGHRESVA
jgi:Arc/MetJ-type ribon-helix-helix transcriptional regulator